MHESSVEAAIVCLLIAALFGGITYAIGAYLFRVAWAGVAGFVVFLIVLALCFLD